MTYCPKCGSEIRPNDRFCNNCGTPAQFQPTQPAAPVQVAPPQTQYGTPPQQYGAPSRAQYGANPPPGKGMAQASMALGIASMVCFGLLAAIPGIILGIKAKNRLEAAGQPSGTATAGIVMSIIGIFLWIVGIALLADM